MENAKSAERGSAKLFSIEGNDHEGLARALGLARGDYILERWMKFGTPVVDRIEGTIQVQGEQLGDTVATFMKLNTAQLEVTAECFPYGIVDPTFRLEVNIQKGQ